MDKNQIDDILQPLGAIHLGGVTQRRDGLYQTATIPTDLVATAQATLAAAGVHSWPEPITLQSLVIAPTTVLCTATEHGTSGPYEVGVEHLLAERAEDKVLVHHMVRRPLVRTTPLSQGYPAEDANIGGGGLLVTRVAHDGPMTEWRIVRAGETEARPIERPAHPPLLNLPDEEHGYAWGDPIDMPSPEPARYYVGPVEVTEAEAYAACDRFAARHPSISRARRGSRAGGRPPWALPSPPVAP